MDNNLKEDFTSVWKNNVWEALESRSGPGSERNSEMVLAALNVFDRIIPEFNIQSLNDIPCGDFNWFDMVLEKYPHLQYHGFDIVSEIITALNEKFPDHQFSEFNAVQDIPPQADLIFCKEMLCHLNDFDVARTLLNFKLSNSRYFVVSTKDGHTANRSKIMKNGMYQPFLLTEAPFNFPAPAIKFLFYDFYLLDTIPLETFIDLLRRTNTNR